LGGGEDWLEIVNPTRTKPLHGIKIVPLDREQLRWAEF
jgi:hypothetical protein